EDRRLGSDLRAPLDRPSALGPGGGRRRRRVVVRVALRRAGRRAASRGRGPGVVRFDPRTRRPGRRAFRRRRPSLQRGAAVAGRDLPGGRAGMKLESDRGAYRLVARREFVERARDRSFLISTAITVLVL